MFLARMADRAAGGEQGVRLRRPSRFEPAPPAPGELRAREALGAGTPRGPEAGRGGWTVKSSASGTGALTSPDGEGGSQGEPARRAVADAGWLGLGPRAASVTPRRAGSESGSGARGSAGEAAEKAVARVAGSPAHGGDDASGGASGGPGADGSHEGGRSAGGSSTGSSPGASEGTPVPETARPAGEGDRGPLGGGTSPRSDRSSAAASLPLPDGRAPRGARTGEVPGGQAPTGPTPAAPSQTDAGGERLPAARPEAPDGRAAGPRATGLGDHARASEGLDDPEPGDTPTPLVDVDAVVRDQVMAALVDRGVVPRGAAGSRTRAALRSSGARVLQEAGSRQVHVHIDRVEVRPPPAPTPAAPARSALPPVDHAAYLARRRGGDR